jgi:hypothetical protein
MIRRRTDGRPGTPSGSRNVVSNTCMVQLYIGSRYTVNRCTRVCLQSPSGKAETVDGLYRYKGFSECNT